MTNKVAEIFEGTVQDTNSQRDDLRFQDTEGVSKAKEIDLLVQLRRRMSEARTQALHARDIEGIDPVIAASHYRHAVEAIIVELKPAMMRIPWAKYRLFEEVYGTIHIEPPLTFERLVDRHWDNIDPRRSHMQPREADLVGLWSLVDLDFPLQETFTLAMKDGSMRYETVTRNVSIRTLTTMHDSISETMRKMGFGIEISDKGGVAEGRT
jgi:hypothetical protein